MDILIDIKLLGKGTTTGVSSYTKELVFELLKRNKYRFKLFYNGFGLNPLPPEWLLRPNASVLNWGVPNKLLQLSTRLTHLPTLDSQGADVIYSPHFHLLSAPKTPRVITFHDLSFVHYPEFFSRKDRIWHWWQNIAAQAASARHLTAVSEYTKADLMKVLNIPEEKITVVYPGISDRFTPLAHTDPNALAVRKKYDLHHPFILYLGTIEPRKNIELLITAFNLLKQHKGFKEYQLILAGRHGLRAKDILQLAHRSPEAADIRCLTTVKDNERAALYSHARLFVYPSFFEGFGFPPLEAQACNTPVIASDRTSLPEILGSSAILINPWKAHELAQAMMHIETNDAVRETMITKGRENARRFTWQESADKLLTVLEHIV